MDGRDAAVVPGGGGDGAVADVAVGPRVVQDHPALARLEAGFVRSAKAYGERKGISYAAWREQGVPAAVLRQAGITRGA